MHCVLINHVGSNAQSLHVITYLPTYLIAYGPGWEPGGQINFMPRIHPRDFGSKAERVFTCIAHALSNSVPHDAGVPSEG